MLSRAPLPPPEPPARPWRVWPYLVLMRPANVVTAVADVAAGATVAGMLWTPQAAGLAVASAALYAGGVTLNDVLDAELDSRERPERPIPSGEAELDRARALACGLLAFGVLVAWGVGVASGLLALTLAAAIALYDGQAKRHPLAGPLTMGSCRALNLLLGLSAAPLLLGSHWMLALLPLAYVGAITLVSRGEVRGGGGLSAQVALGLVSLVVLALMLVGATTAEGLWALPFVALFALRVLPAFQQAAHRPHPLVIRRAVRAGVLSLVGLNAAVAATFGGPVAGLAVLALWPVSGWLARRFAVT